MLSKAVLGWSAVLDGVLIALTQYMGWNASLHYLWAVLAVVWGFLIMQK